MECWTYDRLDFVNTDSISDWSKSESRPGNGNRFSGRRVQSVRPEYLYGQTS